MSYLLCGYASPAPSHILINTLTPSAIPDKSDKLAFLSPRHIVTTLKTGRVLSSPTTPFRFQIVPWSSTSDLVQA
jgi:hypothetical protein